MERLRQALRRLAAALAAALTALAVRGLGATWRLRSVGTDPSRSGGGALGATWHRDAGIAGYVFRDRGLVVPVSLSRDGAFFDRVLRHLGYGPSPRGSTSRGGVALLRQLIRRLRHGELVAVLPDGPRGPAQRAQPGVIALASAAGRPIHPVGFAARPCLRLRSWDRLRVPLPLARVVCLYGEPLAVPKKLDAEVREKLRLELERTLDRLADEAQRRLAGPAARTREEAPP